MNWLDIVILAIIALGAFMGVKTGLISATVTAAGVYIGWLLAGQYSHDVGSIFKDSLSNQTVVTVVSYAIIIIAAILVSRIALKIVKPVLTAATLGLSSLVDRLGGLALGLLMGGAMAGALIILLARFTYDFDVSTIQQGVAGQVVQQLPDVEKTREGLKDALAGSTMVDKFIDVTNKLPASALGFVPTEFRAALDLLEETISLLEQG